MAGGGGWGRVSVLEARRLPAQACHGLPGEGTQRIEGVREQRSDGDEHGVEEELADVVHRHFDGGVHGF